MSNWIRDLASPQEGARHNICFESTNSSCMLHSIKIVTHAHNQHLILFTAKSPHAFLALNTILGFIAHIEGGAIDSTTQTIGLISKHTPYLVTCIVKCMQAIPEFAEITPEVLTFLGLFHAVPTAIARWIGQHNMIDAQCYMTQYQYISTVDNPIVPKIIFIISMHNNYSLELQMRDPLQLTEFCNTLHPSIHFLTDSSKNSVLLSGHDDNFILYHAVMDSAIKLDPSITDIHSSILSFLQIVPTNNLIPSSNPGL